MKKIYKGFECLNSFTYKGTPLSLYKSLKTGLTLALAEIEGPLVNGYITAATETMKLNGFPENNGCPHVLEHLIFLGSEDYPFKGVLDSLANRCYAQGTNAWTDDDHTCYTIETAGSDGFLNILPVYMDHILYPTLTDSGFHTEVHHIDGEGKDAGVVLNEMADRENTGSDLTHHALFGILFEGSGYASNTGGKMEDLRKLNVKTVRDYHRAYYRPSNICAIVSGKLKMENMIDSIIPIEEKIIKKNIDYSHLKRPLTSKIPPLTKSHNKEVLFPSDDDSGGGIVIVGWRDGLIKYSNFQERLALEIMWEYLTETSVAPLQKEFIEIEDPYCAEISYEVTCSPEIAHYIKFENVLTEKVEKIKDKFFEVINEIILKKAFDMKRIISMIKRRKIKFLNGFETHGADIYSHLFIRNFLFATSPHHLEEELKEIERLNNLGNEKQEFWIDLLKKSTSGFYVCINGKPNKEFGENLAKVEQERIATQIKELGPEKLKQLDIDLQNSKKQNEQVIPNELIENFKIPSAGSFSYHQIVTYRTNEQPKSEESIHLQKHLKDENQNFPFFIQFDSIVSDFIQFSIYIDTSSLSTELRQYTPLYLDLLFELPILKEDGTLLSTEEVTYKLRDDTVSYSCSCGIQGGNFSVGSYGQFITLNMKFEKTMQTNGIVWLKDLLWNTQFDLERLKISVNRLVNEVPEYKRSAKSISSAALYSLNFDKTKSNSFSNNFIKQEKFLQSINKKLKKKDESAQIIKELNEFRSILTNPKNFKVHVIGDIFNLKDTKNVWLNSFLPPNYSVISNPTLSFNGLSKEIPYTRNLLSNSLSNNGLIFGISSTDSSNLIQSTVGINDFKDKNIAALKVLIQYLTGLEGPFWKKIRGMGLSYSYSIYNSIEEGLLYFILRKSTSLAKAYVEAQNIVDDYLKGSETFDKNSVDSAKSACIYEIVSTEETMFSAAEQRFYNYLKNVEDDNNKKLILAILKTDVDNLKSVLGSHLINIFDINKSNSVITANSKVVKSIVSDFKRGYVKSEIEKVLMNNPNKQ